MQRDAVGRDTGGATAGVDSTALERWLARPYTPACVAVGGTLLLLPAIGPHLAFDDYVIGLMARAEPPIAGLRQDSLDLFTFTTGLRSDNRALMDAGFLLPWWSNPGLKVAFYRPLSSVLHRLDYALWPSNPEFMYLHGLVWFGLVLSAVALLYRWIESSASLGSLATLLFAADHTHAPVVAWLSNRNALVATFFGVVALLAHHRACHEGRLPARILGLVGSLLSLAAGEFGIATFGYLFAYSAFLETGKLSSRLRSVVPYGVVLAVWAGFYTLSGASVNGSGMYVSPLQDPLRFWQLFPQRAIALFGAAFGAAPSDLSFFGAPRLAPVCLAIALIVLACAASVLLSVLRTDAVARFWLGGALLALVPVTASFPSDRLLLFVSVAAAPLVARLIAPLLVAKQRRVGSRYVLIAAGFFLASRLCGSVVLLPVRSAQMQLAARALSKAELYLSSVPELVRRTVVIVNAPVDIFASYWQAQLAWNRLPRPRHLYWLASSATEMRVTRTDPFSLAVERAGGYFSSPLEQHYRCDPRALHPGSVVELEAMSATVLRSVADGRPLEVAFRFADALESDRYVFLVWQRDHYESFALPPIGTSLWLPAEELGAILMRTALPSR